MRLLILAIACIGTFPAAASELTGSVVPPYPDGFSSDLGSCIPAGEDICAYSIAALNGPDGAVVKILAQKSIGDAGRDTIWEIVDELDAPQQPPGQFWAFEECHLDGIIDASVIGLTAATDMGGWLETDSTVWAARFDVASNRLMELDPGRAECVLPGS